MEEYVTIKKLHLYFNFNSTNLSMHLIKEVYQQFKQLVLVRSKHSFFIYIKKTRIS